MDIWTDILSREPNRIRETFKQLNTAEKIAVRAHLIRMTSDPDWHPEQVKSASIAIEAIKDLPDI
ncbi:MAG TPA: hypothetical protein VLA32_01965 [Anaerolineales bacterium]|jgi:hypothetical protein|nr:hypothetical protein [Anaerolineales bacterium]